jgi:hypothetical protein
MSSRYRAVEHSTPSAAIRRLDVGPGGKGAAGGSARGRQVMLPSRVANRIDAGARTAGARPIIWSCEFRT